MEKNNYKKFILDTLVELLQIDSPSGFCYEINKYLAKKIKRNRLQRKIIRNKKRYDILYSSRVQKPIQDNCFYFQH